MYAVIRHWGAVVAVTEVVTEGLGLSIRYLAMYFYSDDGLVASTQPKRLQRSFGVLIDLFERVELSKNTQKM